MGIFSTIKSLITGKISDEEVASTEWILCPSCNINIEKIDVEENNYICPNCNKKIIKEEI